MALARDGRVVVYMGDDERGEFLYRYVSNGVYVPGGETDDLLTTARSTSRSSTMTAPASGCR